MFVYCSGRLFDLILQFSLLDLNIVCVFFRHWEAIKKWDEAIQLTPDNSSLYEMKSQVYFIPSFTADLISQHSCFNVRFDFQNINQPTMSKLKKG